MGRFLGSLALLGLLAGPAFARGVGAACICFTHIKSSLLRVLASRLHHYLQPNC